MTPDLILDADDLRESQRVAEIKDAAEHVRVVHPDVVLEIGMFTGASMRVWAQCATDTALLIGIEPEFGRVRPFARPRQTEHVIRMTAQHVDALDEVMKALNGRRVDFLFIDGDHMRALDDFNRFAPLVRPGGLIGLHDIAHDAAHFATVAAWATVRTRYRYRSESFVENTPGEAMGIGLLFIPEEERMDIIDTSGNGVVPRLPSVDDGTVFFTPAQVRAIKTALDARMAYEKHRRGCGLCYAEAYCTEAKARWGHSQEKTAAMFDACLPG